MYRTLHLCSNRGGFEAVPDPPRPLDLPEARRRLTAAGVEFVDARVMLIATLEVEVTIGQSGRLLFKTPDLALAERSFARLRGLLDLPASPEDARLPTNGVPDPGRR